MTAAKIHLPQFSSHEHQCDQRKGPFGQWSLTSKDCRGICVQLPADPPDVLPSQCLLPCPVHIMDAIPLNMELCAEMLLVI